MRHFVLLLIALGSIAAAAPGDEHPLADSRITIRPEASPQRFRFTGRWRGASPDRVNPAIAVSTVRVQTDASDTGPILLDSTRWRPLRHGRGVRYADRRGTAGGVQRIVVRWDARGGTLRIAGGTVRWPLTLDHSPARLSVTATIGPLRWCAEFSDALRRTPRGTVRGIASTPPASCPCNTGLTGTWAAIQTAVLERRGCTSAACHGGAASGGLDLRPEVAWSNLVDAEASSLPGRKRVEPGDPETSVLWQKLAKATRGGFADLPGGGMPTGLSPLTEPELDAIATWIRAGAPATGVVAGTDRLLAACLPPSDPIKIRPPAALPTTAGVRWYSPPWEIPPNGEGEVCYATYYDVAASLPPEQYVPCPDDFGGSTRDCFAYARQRLTQDPNSHHSIIQIYRGAYDWTDPGWGTWTCHGGANAGTPCDPTGAGVAAPSGADCGERSQCASTPVHLPACLGYGPPDFGVGSSPVRLGTNNAPAVSLATEPLLDTRFPPDVYGVLPIRGLVVWNSHAFNATDTPTTNEQWLDFYFAAPDARRYRIEEIFAADEIFAMHVPPFDSREICRTETFPQGTRIVELSSHTHKRGVLFRIWGPGTAPTCMSDDPQCTPESSDPILVTTDYADPAVTRFDPPLTLDDSDPATRTFKFCARYDNGKTDPSTVRRRRGMPAFATPCPESDVVCLAGPHRGQPCGGDDARCDTSPGAGDGSCDACPLRGGVTTEDEMFIMLGRRYVVPTAP